MGLLEGASSFYPSPSTLIYIHLLRFLLLHYLPLIGKRQPPPELSRKAASGQQEKQRGPQPGDAQATAWEPPPTGATWMRTEKGPQRHWLHHAGKTENPYCPCSPDTIQTGLHITFTCPLHTPTRNRLLGNKQSWEGVDTPHTVRIGDEDTDGVMLFFEYIFDQLT